MRVGKERVSCGHSDLVWPDPIQELAALDEMTIFGCRQTDALQSAHSTRHVSLNHCNT